LADLEKARSSGRLAHALLIEGPEGLGKLDLAFLLAARVLEVAPVTEGDRMLPPVHPDFHWVTLEEDEKGKTRRQITVDQIREACAELAMTSYGGGNKVTVIAPADRMNRNASNSLLKTLEEPTPGTLLILVRMRLDTLPATIASRCQRVRLTAPGTAVAERWLSDRASEPREWTRLLHFAGGAPLRAERLAAEGFLDTDTRFSGHLAGLLAGRLDPVDVAAEWAGEELPLCLAWLQHWTTRVARRLSLGNWEIPPAVDMPESVIEAIPPTRVYWYLDAVNTAMRRTDGSLNVELTLENLLVPWAHGLEPSETRV
jgi:DNA polymerase-3 subunit delta'